MARFCNYLGLSALTLALSFPALGGTADTFGLSPVANALGRANLSTNAFGWGVQTNPAVLTRDKKTLVSVNALSQNFALKNTNHQRSQSPLSGIEPDNYQAEDAETLYGASFAATVPLSRKLTLGVAGHMHGNALARVLAVTGKESFYLHYDDRQVRPEIFTALGLRISPSFSLGAGLFYSFKAEGTMQLAASQEDADSRMLIELSPVMIPYAGLTYTERFNGLELVVGPYYRFEHEADTKIAVDIASSTRLASIPFEATSELVSYYDPQVLGAGIGLIGKDFGVYFDLKRKFWSGYDGPIIDLKGKDIEDLSEVQDQRNQPDLEDNWNVGIGVDLPRLSWGSGHVKFRSGVEYHSSTLRENPASLAFVDSDRTSFSLGASVREGLFKNFIKSMDYLDIYARWTQIDSEELKVVDQGSVKQTSDVGGGVFDFGLGVRFEI